MENGEVRIANKETESYLKAALFSLDKFGNAVLKALGGRQNKLIEIIEELEKINGIVVESRRSIMVEGTPGLEVRVKREREDSG